MHYSLSTTWPRTLSVLGSCIQYCPQNLSPTCRLPVLSEVFPPKQASAVVAMLSQSASKPRSRRVRSEVAETMSNKTAGHVSAAHIHGQVVPILAADELHVCHLSFPHLSDLLKLFPCASQNLVLVDPRWLARRHSRPNFVHSSNPTWQFIIILTKDHHSLPVLFFAKTC